MIQNIVIFQLNIEWNNSINMYISKFHTLVWKRIVYILLGVDVRKPSRVSPYEKTLSFLCDSRLNFNENPKNFHIFRAVFCQIDMKISYLFEINFTKWQDFGTREKHSFSRVPKSSVISWWIFSNTCDDFISFQQNLLGIYGSFWSFRQNGFLVRWGTTRLPYTCTEWEA